MKKHLLVLGITLTILGGFFFPLVQKPVESVSLSAALPAAVAVFETSLASPITSAATSMTLTTNAVRGGTTLSGYNCFTVDEGGASAEFICGTVSGTAVSAMTRGIDPATGTSTVSALQFTHRRGANVKITDFPLITILRNQNNGIETFPNLLTYTNTVACGAGSATTTLCPKAYMDALAIAGVSNGDTVTNGIYEQGTAAEASSTATTGGTGANLVVGTNLVGATPAASIIAMTQSTGKLLQGFWDLAANFIWSGAHTFNNTVTLNSTTTSPLPIKYFGDGSDGVVTLAVATTTLTRDMFYDTLTIPAGATVTPSSFKIYVKNTLTVSGKIDRSGNEGHVGIAGTASDTGAIGATSTVATSSGSVFGWHLSAFGGMGGSGGVGGAIGLVGGNGSSTNNNLISTAGVSGGAGGTSGNCGSGTKTGGAGGSPSVSSSASSSIKEIEKLILMFDHNGLFTTAVNNGGGGGGGGSYAGGSCGGGGGGGGAGTNGGVLWIAAKNIVVNSPGIISANGGSGGKGGNAATYAAGGGGGAGGNGGVLVFIYETLSNAGSISANGGTGGNGGTSANGGSGTVGGNGNVGQIIYR